MGKLQDQGQHRALEYMLLYSDSLSTQGKGQPIATRAPCCPCAWLEYNSARVSL